MPSIDISSKALEWLATGNRGISSETIFSVMTGMQIYGRHGPWHPFDPSDFVRCEALLRAVPEFRARLSEMRNLSAEWNALVEHWNKIVALLEQEVPGVFMEWPYGRSAPKTYDLMNKLLTAAKDGRK